MLLPPQFIGIQRNPTDPKIKDGLKYSFQEAKEKAGRKPGFDYVQFA
jgi:hypothetical protein